MAEPRRTSKTRLGLAICIVLVTILAVSNVWLYATVDGLQRQASTLKTHNNELEDQINDLQSYVDTVNTTRIDSKPTLLWKYKTGDHVQRTSISNSFGQVGNIRIVAGSDDQKVYVFDAWGLLWQRQLEGKVWGASASPNGEYIAADTEGGSLYFFDEEGNLLWQDKVANDAYEAGVSYDGEYAVFGSLDWENLTYSAYLFNKTGSLLWMRKALDACGVAISDDGKSIAVGADQEFVFLYNRDGEQVWKYEAGGAVTGVSMSGDANLIVAVSNDGCVYALDRNGTLIWKYDTGVSGWEVSVSRDGQYVASSSENLVCFFDKSGNLIWQHAMPEETEGVGLSEHGEFLVLGSYDGYVYLFRAL
jgi:outer membrane protein assembly factor BamB